MITNEEMNKEILNENIQLAMILLTVGSKSEQGDLENLSEFNKLITEASDINNSIAAKLIKIKIAGYGVKINTPDWLICLIELCANGCPGFIQIIYKELLKYINKNIFDNTGIPENYTIKASDFANCFPLEFPIILNPKIEEKYTKIWDEQKIETTLLMQSDNKCDTAEYWLEVTK